MDGYAAGAVKCATRPGPDGGAACGSPTIRTYHPDGRHPPPMPGQGRDGRRHRRLGRVGAVAREEAVAAAVGHFRDLLIGADPMARGAIWQRLYRSQYFEGGRVLTAAQSAIDIALYDICGKALGVPVYELLGGRQRDFVPLFATAGAADGPGAHRGRPRTGRRGLAGDPALPEHAGRGRRRVRRSAGSRRRFVRPADDALQRTRPLRAPRGPRRDRASGRPGCARPSAPGSPWGSTGTIVSRRRRQRVLASGCRPARSTSSRSRSAPRTPTPTRSSGRLIDVPLAIGEEFVQQVGVPAVHRARADRLRAGRRLQRRRLHGGDEGRGLGGGTLPGPHAAQPARADLHGRDRPPVHGRPERFVDGDPALADGGPGLLRSQPVPGPGRRRTVPGCILIGRPGLGVEVDESRLEEAVAGRWQPPQLHRRDGSVQNW